MDTDTPIPSKIHRLWPYCVSLSLHICIQAFRIWGRCFPGPFPLSTFPTWFLHENWVTDVARLFVQCEGSFTGQCTLLLKSIDQLTVISLDLKCMPCEVQVLGMWKFLCCESLPRGVNGSEYYMSSQWYCIHRFMKLFLFSKQNKCLGVLKILIIEKKLH